MTIAPSRWHIAALVFVTFLLLFVMYCLSYAPLYSAVRSPNPYASLSGPQWIIYAPVDWMHDHTYLQKPLSAWAAIWGVEDDFLNASSNRRELDWQPSKKREIDEMLEGHSKK